MTNDLRKWIKETIDTELKEEATTVSQAVEQKVALHIFDSLNTREFYLYTLEGELKILGSLKLKLNKECQTFVVSWSAANKGLGPLLYEIAMSYEGKLFLAPSRDSVSDKAKNVWQKFFTREDIVKEKLPSSCYDENSEEIFKYKYTVLNPVDYQSLVKKHKENMFKAPLYRKTKSQLETTIEEEGYLFFSKNYS